jgi:hypothetical protein
MALTEYKLFKQLVKAPADSNDQSHLDRNLVFIVDSTFIKSDDENSIEVSLNGQQIIDHLNEPTTTFAKYYYSYIITVPTTSGVSTTISASAKTIVRADAGSFLLDGFAVGQNITTLGYTNAGNNGTFVISAISPNGKTLTFTTATGFVDETTSAGSLRLNTAAANSDLYCTLTITISANQAFTAPGYAVGEFGLGSFLAADSIYISFYKTVIRDI